MLIYRVVGELQLINLNAGQNIPIQKSVVTSTTLFYENKSEEDELLLVQNSLKSSAAVEVIFIDFHACSLHARSQHE